MNFYQELLDKGLVRVLMFTDGTTWWVGPDRANSLIANGLAIKKPITKEELEQRGLRGSTGTAADL